MTHPSTRIHCGALCAALALSLGQSAWAADTATAYQLKQVIPRLVVTQPTTGSGASAPSQPASTTSTSALSFGGLDVGAISPEQGVLLINTGSQVLTLGTPTVTGPFRATTDCSTTLGIDRSCQTAVQFAPQTFGTFSGELTLPNSGGDKTVTLSGTGLSASFELTAALSNSLLLPDAAVGMRATPDYSIGLRNSGNVGGSFVAPQPVGTMATEFPVSTTCTNIPAGAPCAVVVGFRPAGTGLRTAQLLLQGVQVSLSGTGYVGDAASVSPSTLSSFPGTLVGATSPSQVVRVQNDGFNTLTLSLPSVSGDFAVDSTKTTCGATVLRGANCDLALKFTPTTFGTRTGTLQLTTSAGAKSVDLSATGQQASFALTDSPATTFTYPATTVSSAQPTVLSIPLKNIGNIQGTLPVPTLSGANPTDFTVSSTCSNVAANGTCSVTATFAPQTTGTKTATFTVAGTTFTVNGTANPAVTYATWDPAYNTSAWKLSNNNLTFYTTVTGPGVGGRATVGKSSGKWYWEVTYQSGGKTFMQGIISSSVNMATAGCLGCGTAPAQSHWRVVYSTGTWGTPATSTDYSAAGPKALMTNGPSIGDTYGFALDMDNYTLKVYYKRAGGTCSGPYLTWTGLSAGTWYPVASTGGGTHTVTANFGQNAFACTPPAGFVSLN